MALSLRLAVMRDRLSLRVAFTAPAFASAGEAKLYGAAKPVGIS
jgi:hypothetical protein